MEEKIIKSIGIFKSEHLDNKVMKQQGRKKPVSKDKFYVVPQTIAIKFNDKIKLPYIDGVEKHFKKIGLFSFDEILQTYPGLTINRMFTTLSRERIEALNSKAHESEVHFRRVNLLSWYRIVVPTNVKAQSIVERLKELYIVEKVYVESGPTRHPTVNWQNNPRAQNQGYETQAPDGIDARYAWTVDGGDGEGVQFIDIEGGWTLIHEDLIGKGVTILSGLSNNDFQHGTSVLGEVVAVDNDKGDVGISPNVDSAYVVGEYRTTPTDYNIADAIASAADALNPGDVLLIEEQSNQNGLFLPIEVEDAIFDAIRNTTRIGIVVVEPAANGSYDLDTYLDSVGNQTLNRNSRDFKDSGAIVVGAASSLTPHVRLDFSNFGSRVDCYAWGENVDTLDTDSTGQATNRYTSQFAGTSASSPIIAGAAISVQGVFKALQRPNQPYLSPNVLRGILHDNGTDSSNPSTDKIGRMPDLAQIIDSVLPNL